MLLLGVLAWLMFPALLAAVAVSAAGILWGRPAWVLVGALLAGPFSLYLHKTPRFEWVGLLPMACPVGRRAPADPDRLVSGVAGMDGDR